MKIKYILPVVVLALILGCTTAKVTPANPATGTPATTNYIVDPRLTTVLDTGHAVVGATSAINPYAGLLDLGLGAVAAVATWFAKRKNDQAKGSALLTKTVIQGVEASGSAEAKAAIEKHATLVGVQGALSDLVYNVTK
jgi:hypothetical protein